jgi:DNA/RNA-binding domain of Phe-tRNA-synthetase-like protein
MWKNPSLNFVYVQELGSRMRSSSENMVAKVKKTSEMPKLAPQLDGLNCFETLICH